KLLESVHCPVTELRVTAERAFLAVMDGSCKTPLAALMTVPDPQGRAKLEALAASEDGRQIWRSSFVMEVAHTGDAARLGEAAGRDILKQQGKA
ncbi:MAG TPA: hydroxymethylbilane synthase, partial [Patescibacteria group bacterium]|nr:hydroxymethylbilane synthase [Patescibacteria group bacterium]